MPPPHTIRPFVCIEGAVVTRRITDDTLPGGSTTREIVYHAPFTRTNREHDYMVAWNELHYRAGSIPSRFHSTQANLSTTPLGENDERI